jgi:Tol biopolymer transport system component
MCDRDIRIYPDYPETIIPRNICPFNFRIDTEGDVFRVRFVAGTDSFEVKSVKKITIPSQKWKNLLNNHPGERLIVKFFVKTGSTCLQYRDKQFFIADEPIDAYLVYRLIEPGYELWSKMGIYQRSLEDFAEKPVLLNTQTERNCINCHSFCRNRPENMLFHLRTTYGGTMFVKDGTVKKVDTKSPGEISAGVYPRWHPDGRYVAFSVNSTHQSFHTANENVLEVYDKKSDLILFDTETGRIITDNIIHRADRFETFPEWSPDGCYLYFCSAAVQEMPKKFDSLRYDLLRVAFDPETCRFGTQIDTLISSEILKKSVAFPRISPDGKCIAVCLTAYGTFPIWHHDNDIYLLDPETRELIPAQAINSDQSDSYHSWSSNGRWFVFSSRRIGSLYTRLFIAYFDRNGYFHKPFLLPQKDPEYYDFSMKSYNVPELIVDKIKVSSHEFEKAAKSPGRINPSP